MSNLQPTYLFKKKPVPTWGRDFRRVVLYGLFIAILLTLMVGMSAVGLMFGKQFQRIEPSPMWAGICAGILPLMYPFMVFGRERDDKGYRRQGLVPLLVLGIPAAVAVEVLVMMSWPLILGDHAGVGIVAADLTTDPLSILLVFTFLTAATAFFTAVVIIMLPGKTSTGFIMAVPLVGGVFYFIFTSKKIFENAPSGKAVVIWASAALACLAFLAIMAALRNSMDPPRREPTEQEKVQMAVECKRLMDRRGKGEQVPPELARYLPPEGRNGQHGQWPDQNGQQGQRHGQWPNQNRQHGQNGRWNGQQGR